MMPFFNRTGLERVGVVGSEPGLLWTDAEISWIAGAVVGLLQCWSAGSGCGSSLQKEQERRRADKGFARGRSDA